MDLHFKHSSNFMASAGAGDKPKPKPKVKASELVR